MFDMNINGGNYFDSMESYYHDGGSPDFDSEFIADSLYYHVKLNKAEIKRETEKARLVSYKDSKGNDIELWLPKKIMRSCAGCWYAHAKTLNIIVPKRFGTFD